MVSRRHRDEIEKSQAPMEKMVSNIWRNGRLEEMRRKN
jgi:hypothetical protein